MTLLPGAKLGPYEVLSAIGAGGMGEVYKARDTRLDRAVAIKLLRQEFADRSDRRERFRREARAISTLSHPNICSLFDVGEDGDRAFLVMEFLEGETLDDRLTRGPLRANEVLLYATQIADALDHAHKQGITHRDLKPSNVMLTPTGAKLLDFGLARGPVLEPTGLSETQTFDNPRLTAEGTLLGTVQYMAPEQLEGQTTDARTDIFAFGMLVYEMATAKKAFDGGSPASLIAAILTGQIPILSTSRSGTDAEALPPAIDHFVERCLAKRPEDRWQTARDMKLELEWIGRDRSGQMAAQSRGPLIRREAVAWSVAALATAVAIGIFVQRSVGGPIEFTKFTLDLPPGSTIALSNNRTRVAVSDDGSRVVFVASKDGRQQLWVRALSSLDAKLLPGTDGAFSPFWSPDGRSIGFYAQGPGEIRVTSADAGPVRTVCRAELDGNATWTPDGTILFTQLGAGIFRVPAAGGTPQQITTLDKAQRELSHYWPALLPDGRRFLYLATALDENGVRTTSSLYAAPLEGGERTLVTRMNSRAVYAEPGHLLFVQDGALLAQPFDAATLRLTGEPQSIAEEVAYQRTLGNGGFSVSSNGVVAYQGSPSPYQLAWYNRSGTLTRLDWAPQGFGNLRLSPDGRSIAADVRDPRAGTSDILEYDLTRGAPTRFTSDPNFNENNPVWSPDGRELAFRDDRRSAPAIFARTRDGRERLLVPGSGPLTPEDWSRNGEWIAYRDNSRLTGADLTLLPMRGDLKPRPFLATSAEEWGARFSPNSRWLAYVSTESVTSEVFIAGVPAALERRRISVGGGLAPRWRDDGKELYYVAADRRTVMAVPISVESPLTIGTPVRRFTMAAEPALTSFRDLAFEVTNAGDRFLVALPATERVTSQIVVVKNWMAALARR